MRFWTLALEFVIGPAVRRWMGLRGFVIIRESTKEISGTNLIEVSALVP